jgi:hypothetical protein
MAEDRYKPNWLSTELRAYEGEDWQVLPDLKPDPDNEGSDDRVLYARLAQTRHGVRVPAATLRRIGWLDQRGRVWQEVPPGAKAEEMRCGSFTPLLIDVRGDD